jgi:hypothetical protein
MKTGDKISTVIFWAIAGSAGLAFGCFSLYGAYVATAGKTRYLDLLFALLFAMVGIVMFCLVGLGVRECWRALRGGKKNGNAA